MNSIFGYGTDILEHFLIEHGFDPSAAGLENEEDAQGLMEMIEACYQYLSSDVTFSGFIVKKAANEAEEYMDYLPMRLNQFEPQMNPEIDLLTFPKFSTAIDEFYGKIQTQKQEQKMHQAEKAALKKLENVKLDHMKRLDGLKKSQEDNVTKAQLIEMNLELVEARCSSVKHAPI